MDDNAQVKRMTVKDFFEALASNADFVFAVGFSLY